MLVYQRVCEETTDISEKEVMVKSHEVTVVLLVSCDLGDLGDLPWWLSSQK